MAKEFEFSGFGYPNESGVYGFFEVSQLERTIRPMYIGSSKSISKRVLSHPFRRFIPNGITYAVGYIITDNYTQLEIDLIKKYNPPYNVQHRTNL